MQSPKLVILFDRSVVYIIINCINCYNSNVCLVVGLFGCGCYMFSFCHDDEFVIFI